MDLKPSTIREGRHIKSTARAENVDLRGRTSDIFSEQIVPELQAVIGEAVNTHRGWLENEWRKQTARLRVKKPVPFDEALPHFQETLEKRVKLYSRTVEKPLATFVGDRGLMDMLCEQAAFDFIMSLRTSAQEGETVNNALKIASLSHWLNPMDMKRLGEKYKDRVDNSVIKSAALSYPKNPDAFIDSYIGEIDRLGEKYKDRVDNSVISRAALSYPKNPDAFIDWYVNAHDILSQRGSKKYIIQQVLMSNAFKSIDELLSLV